MLLIKKIIFVTKKLIKRVIIYPILILKPGHCIALVSAFWQFADQPNMIFTRSIVDKAAGAFEYRPKISVITEKTGLFNYSVASLYYQSFKFHEIKEVDAGVKISKELMKAVNRTSGEYILFVKGGDYLYPDALFELVTALNNNIEKKPDLVFSDHDYYNKQGKVDSFFKPGWSPDLFMVNNYISRAFLIKKDTLFRVLADEELEYKRFESFIYHICLKATENGIVKHLQRILFSFPESDKITNIIDLNEVRVRVLRERGDDAYISENKYSIPTVIRKVTIEPKVSIIIPTCFKDEYIDSCLRSIRKKSTYKNYEIIVLDNSLKDPSYGKERLKEFNCKIIYINQSFNWACFNNFAVKHAIGEVYVFLNDDTEVISEDWLERLVSNAIRKEIGVVGPLLLYPNNNVQHAGIFLIDHDYWSRHCFAGLPEEYTGYHNILHYQRNCLALTGACLAISKEKFEEIGGFDETFLITHNDVDFCLRLWEKGYYQLYLPEVRLYHKEMASRQNVPDKTGDKLFEKKWSKLISQGDPFYNINLSPDCTDFRLK